MYPRSHLGSIQSRSSRYFWIRVIRVIGKRRLIKLYTITHSFTICKNCERGSSRHTQYISDWSLTNLTTSTECQVEELTGCEKTPYKGQDIHLKRTKPTELKKVVRMIELSPQNCTSTSKVHVIKKECLSKRR